jgi:2-dehydro-3-deoxy-D-arabinonate dehydratase
MKLYKTTIGNVVASEGSCYILSQSDWDIVINQDNLYDFLAAAIATTEIAGNSDWLLQQQLLTPIGNQEVWAAGVTYLRSKTARVEESLASGGATFYDKVYDAPRPELFFKANANKVVGINQCVRIRKDSNWNVPEPELTLIITSSGKIVGYTIGNDMSSRNIEGENPLYLPQAKMYDGSAAIGPCVLVTNKPISPLTEIYMNIKRAGNVIFEGSTTIDRMKRTHEELVKYLFLEYSYPNGCYLMTGTCVVPENDFTLHSNDIVTIKISGIGELINSVA